MFSVEKFVFAFVICVEVPHPASKKNVNVNNVNTILDRIIIIFSTQKRRQLVRLSSEGGAATEKQLPP